MTDLVRYSGQGPARLPAHIRHELARSTGRMELYRQVAEDAITEIGHLHETAEIELAQNLAAARNIRRASGQTSDADLLAGQVRDTVFVGHITQILQGTGFRLTREVAGASEPERTLEDWLEDTLGR